MSKVPGTEVGYTAEVSVIRTKTAKFTYVIRITETINIDGIMVYPTEIESVLHSHPTSAKLP